LAVQYQELAKPNQQLKQRVTDQVGEIERMGRLRRFLPPQVADLIIASGTEKQLESLTHSFFVGFGSLDHWFAPSAMVGVRASAVMRALYWLD
jgi:hypothetical protein